MTKVTPVYLDRPMPPSIFLYLCKLCNRVNYEDQCTQCGDGPLEDKVYYNIEKPDAENNVSHDKARSTPLTDNEAFHYLLESSEKYFEDREAVWELVKSWLQQRKPMRLYWMLIMIMAEAIGNELSDKEVPGITIMEAANVFKDRHEQERQANNSGHDPNVREHASGESERSLETPEG